MTVFEIRDSKERADKLLGYLFYYEKSHRFFAEILPEIDEWDAPFIFASFVKRGIYSINSEWSMRFVRQRIVPSDRQNLGAILKANNIKMYDEYKLLQLSEGRCAQDELYLVKCGDEDITIEIRERLDKKVKDVVPMNDHEVMVFFLNDYACTVDVEAIRKDNRLFSKVLSEPETFKNVRVSPGGNGIEWGEERFISAEELSLRGKSSELKYSDLLSFVSDRIVDTTETASILNCTRQYIGQLSSKGKLIPIKSGSNNNLYLKSDIERADI